MATDLGIRPSLARAVRKNGPPGPWTRRLALAVLVDAMRETGRAPSPFYLVQHGCPSDATYRRLFGSMNYARGLAEIELARLKEIEA